MRKVSFFNRSNRYSTARILPAGGRLDQSSFSIKMSDEAKFQVKYGCGIGIGGRPYQEDRLVVAKTSIPGQSDSYFFAVFDGHGGDNVSAFLSKNFHAVLSAHPKFSMLPIAALQETWAGFDDRCYSELQRIESASGQKLFPTDGSTATVCMVTGDDVYVTNCGDSACYSVGTNGDFSILTEDHGTGNAVEVTRCVKAGGTMKEQRVYTPFPFPLCCANQLTIAKPRVMPGGLLVTRAFGDFNAKVDYLGGRKGVVIHTHGRINYINAAKALPKYIILASDGIWDALSTEEIAKVIASFSQLPAGDTDVELARASPTPSAGSGSPSRVHPYGTFVQSPYIQANVAESDPELTKLAAMLVEAAVRSPKWDEMGKHDYCAFSLVFPFVHKLTFAIFFVRVLQTGSPADNTSIIIIAFTPATTGSTV